MKSKTLLFTLVGACVLPLGLSAQASDVQIYGTFLPFVDHIKTSGATAPGLSPANGGATQVAAGAYTGDLGNLPGRNRMTSGTSNLGFKGSFKINEDLKLIWQIESAISPDGDAPNSLTSRNSCVGLAGSWGTVFYGNWDTPYKFPLLFVGALRGLSPFDNALTANPGFNVPGTTTQNGRANAKADAAFNRRQGNSIQYWSPVVNGFSGRIAYSVNEGKTVATATVPSVSPELWSVLLSYKAGAFNISYGIERHSDYFGLAQLGGSAGATATNASSKDIGHELVAAYAFSTGTKVSAIVERLSYDTDDTVVGRVNHYERDAWYLLVQQRWGTHQLFGAYGTANAGSAKVVGGGPATTNGLGGKQWSAGYVYSLAKSADLYTSVYGMTNERSASYALFPPVGSGVAPGASTTGFGLGILYTF
ncbi:MAG: porin [Holophagaceae bacterium]|uniref:Porin n=1 Tax=Candidatus Geothrix skivensis TaxID=2954439 RepID=A0A9D7XMM3_9BACT|nr:porin [Candidatus Geothrix skivensis]